MLARGFWLYVWEVTDSSGKKWLYVGRTGDSSSPNAQDRHSRVGVSTLAVIAEGTPCGETRMQAGVDADECRSFVDLLWADRRTGRHYG